MIDRSDLQEAVETILRSMPTGIAVRLTDLEDEIDVIRTQPDMWRLSAKSGWIFLGDSWQASNAAVILPCFFKVEHDNDWYQENDPQSLVDSINEHNRP